MLTFRNRQEKVLQTGMLGCQRIGNVPECVFNVKQVDKCQLALEFCKKSRKIKNISKGDGLQGSLSKH